MKYPKISIVTPCFNQAEYIEQTILSILDQKYPNLEYIIIDGGSTDETTDVIKKYADRLHYWVSEKDDGLYDALQKGFEKTTGEIMGWLNADDLLHRNSLFTIAEIFSSFPDIQWLQGYPTVADEQGRIIYHRKQVASKYPFYAGEYKKSLFIQQESTYWRRDLWVQAGSRIATNYKYAADFELWMRFFKYVELYNTTACIGTFRVRKGQLSAVKYDLYLRECDEIIEKYKKELSTQDIAVLSRYKKIRYLFSKFPFLEKAGILEKYGKAIHENDHFVNYDFAKHAFVKVV